jgi:hypothetical protein
MYITLIYLFKKVPLYWSISKNKFNNMTLLLLHGFSSFFFKIVTLPIFPMGLQLLMGDTCWPIPANWLCDIYNYHNDDVRNFVNLESFVGWLQCTFPSDSISSCFCFVFSCVCFSQTIIQSGSGCDGLAFNVQQFDY